MKIRNFNEIYEKLLKEKNPIIDTLHRRKLISAGAIFVILFLALLFFKHISNYYIITIFAIAEIFAVILYIVISTKYRTLYKQTVISNLVKAYCSDLQFDSKRGVSSFEYNRADFRDYYDRFHSEDLIYGNIDDEFYIKMSEVKTEKKETTTDSNGKKKTYYVTIFQGIYGFIDIKSKIIPYFEISSNRFFSKYDKLRIEVDSAEFEKNYDLYAEDKIRTMEIFTADLIEDFNKFKQNLKIPIQVKIKNGTLYFRLRMNNSFEAPILGKAFDFDSMYHNFKLIDEPLKLFSRIFENAKDV